MKGWIALDIDGTITRDKYSVPDSVVQFLRETAQNGWKIAFATGRAFVFAEPLLKCFDFPFIFIGQNGSIAIEGQKIIFKRYMKPSVISDFEEAYSGLETDFIVYSGHENRDRCYFRPHRFSKEDRLYVEEIQKREKEPWIAVDQFPLDFDIPLIKCFGRLDVMKKIGGRLLKKGHFQVSLIRDPFHSSYQSVQRFCSPGNLFFVWTGRFSGCRRG
jgi:hydroxymethylpyrimidine pyrophosphatase-like HAD family hydrolase